MLSYIIVGIGFIFGVIFLLVKSSKGRPGNNKKGEISGAVYGKISEQPIKNVKVFLGQMEAKTGNDNSFRPLKDCIIETDKDGRFTFNNIELKKYWVMAEYKGKKVLTYVKISKEYPIIDDIILKV